MADAGLDWRPVTTPDISSGSLQGLDVFSRLIGSAGRRVTAGIQGAEDRGNEQAALAATRAVAGMTADEIEAGLRDGSLTADKRLRAENIRGLQAQAVDALKFSEGKLNLEKLQVETDQRKARDGYAGQMAQIMSLDAAGKREEGDAIASTIDFSKIGYTAVGDFMEDRRNGFAGFQSARQNDQQFDLANKQETRTATTFKQGLDDREDARTGQGWIAAMARLGFTSPEQLADRAMDDPNLTPGQRFFILGSVGGGISSGASAAGGTPSAPGGATSGVVTGPSAQYTNDPMRVMNYEAVGRGYTVVPESVKTLGDAYDFGRGINISNQAKYGEPGSSAMGPFQVVRTTMERHAKKLFGNEWRTQNYDMGVMDQIGSSIFAEARGSVKGMRDEWSAFKKMSDTEVEAVRRMDWDDAKVVIARIEGATDLKRADALRQDAATEANLKLTDGDAPTSFINQYIKIRGEPAKNAIDAAGGDKTVERALISANSVLSNLPAGERLTGINNQAILGVMRDIAKSPRLLGRTFSQLNPNYIPIGDGRYVDKDELVTALRSRETEATTAAANTATTQSQMAALPQLKSRETALQSQIETLARRNGGSRTAGNIPNLMIELASVQGQIQAVQAGGGTGRSAAQEQARPAPPTPADTLRAASAETVRVATAARVAADRARTEGTPEARAAAAVASAAARNAAEQLRALQAAAQPAARAPVERESLTSRALSTLTQREPDRAGAAARIRRIRDLENRRLRARRAGDEAEEARIAAMIRNVRGS